MIANEILMSFRKQKSNENLISLEETLDVNNNESNLSLKDSLQDDFEIEEFCEKKENRREVFNLITSQLEGRERQIIILRYGIGNNPPMTQQQVCEILGISRSYVSRLETKALGVLRKSLTEAYK